MPRPAAAREAGRIGGRPAYPRRLWRELGSVSGEHDGFVKLIILERLAKATILVLVATGFTVAGRTSLLDRLALEAQEQLALSAGRNLIARLLDRGLGYLGHYPHRTILALAVIVYALLEGAEGVGLYLHRRWAEYLTVVGTGALIPFEVAEVIHRVTPFRVSALLLNAAVVGWLAYRKRLFLGV